ncbi:MAG: sulfite exporter TauE/SafE family protein [Daejeonella sp.]
MNVDALAFFTGLFGSLHCVAMCGPLLMALPMANGPAWLSLLHRTAYQAGRIITYSLLGLIFGLLGQSFNFLGWQQGISILTGIILFFLAISHFAGQKNGAVQRWQMKLINPISIWMGKLLMKPYGGLFAGMLNGILPCGMVYLALAGAVNSESVWSGARFMMYFGLGTSPLMLIASVAGMYLRRFSIRKFSRVLPFLTLAMSIWFLLRGAGLNIMYLSPFIEVNAPAVCK